MLSSLSFHLDRPRLARRRCANDLLELLLGAELVGVTALLLALWGLLVHDVGMAGLPLVV